ncbi:MAG: HAD domain-containing protein [Zoogloea sp.]|uniref:HAD domain-containing protein n=1 Tax=Zoogloea sp. TaxID=49181 RepID=UPI002639C966|nr:HAD domain-containing protein [Zoogloea sp.]MDD3326566.1 HAD domain-containing protein [Zoogloea sp.]
MILFLDFDGVLHPDAVYLERGRPVLRADGELFMWAGHLVDALARAPHARIVLSTSWARELRFARARDYLPAELRPRVIGATWHSGMASDAEHRPLGRDTWWDTSPRYQQIRRYADRAGLTDWIAVDDYPEGWADADRDKLVTTDSSRGLSAPSARVRLSLALGNTPNAWAVADTMADLLSLPRVERSETCADLMCWVDWWQSSYLTAVTLEPAEIARLKAGRWWPPVSGEQIRELPPAFARRRIL